MNKPKDTDSYIAGFSGDIQKKLKQLRATIRKVAPDAEEVISYNMPAYKQNGILVYFAAHKNHIGFYPASRIFENFSGELTTFHCSKGTIQFPHNKPLPINLIKKIIKYRVNENLQKAKAKKSKAV